MSEGKISVQQIRLQLLRFPGQENSICSLKCPVTGEVKVVLSIKYDDGSEVNFPCKVIDLGE